MDTERPGYVNTFPMQCKNCDYPLWNLKARQCPECGHAFLPSEFEFVINSVCFCCPHCKQGYYGTDAQGHLVPSSFDCVTCRQRIAMDEMVLFPASGVAEHETKVDQAPWLARERLGRVKAWFRTVFQGLFMPNALIRGVPPESSAGQAWWYAIVTSAVFSTVNVLTFVGMVFLIAMVFGGTGGVSGMLGFATAMLITVISVWLGLLMLTALWGLTTHGMLLILGGGKWPVGRTFHAICYSMGGAALLAVPLIGIYPFGFIPMIWWVVSAMVMMANAQGVHPGKAIVATGAFPLVMTLIVFGGLFALVYFSVTMAQTAITQAAAMSATNATQIVQQGLGVAGARDGVYPAFALETIDESVVEPLEFASSISTTDPQRVLIGEKTLLQIAVMEDEERNAYIQRVADAMPEDVVAHRVGDFVFTYHGMTPDAEDGTLWLVVVVNAPLPAGAPAFPAPVFMNQITVVMSNGTTIVYQPEQFDAALEAQNDARQAMGLPALPDPRLITLEKPVVRGEGEAQAYGVAEP